MISYDIMQTGFTYDGLHGCSIPMTAVWLERYHRGNVLDSENSLGLSYAARVGGRDLRKNAACATFPRDATCEALFAYPPLGPPLAVSHGRLPPLPPCIRVLGVSRSSGR